MNDIYNYNPFIAHPPEKNFNLYFKYTFNFKWRRNILNPKNIVNPSKQTTYPIPRNFLNTIQTQDPANKAIKTQFHKWKYRRELLTTKALKRALQDTNVENSCSTNSKKHPVKKKHTKKPTIYPQKNSNIHQVLQSSKKNSYQKTKTKTQLQLKFLKQQQQLQQHLLKYIHKLQKKQKYINLLTKNIK